MIWLKKNLKWSLMYLNYLVLLIMSIIKTCSKKRIGRWKKKIVTHNSQWKDKYKIVLTWNGMDQWRKLQIIYNNYKWRVRRTKRDHSDQETIEINMDEYKIFHFLQIWMNLTMSQLNGHVFFFIVFFYFPYVESLYGIFDLILLLHIFH